MNERIGNSEQICSARRVMALDGEEAGTHLIELSNGVLNVTLNESSCLDIYQLFYKGMNASFISRNGLVKNDVPFLQYFPAGMLYTCGPDAIGGKEGCPMHGTFHHTPSKIIELKSGEDGVKVVAETKYTQLFGAGLKLTRTISLENGTAVLKLHDELKNENYRDEKYNILYHINIGYPLLDIGCSLEGNFTSVLPRDIQAAAVAERVYEIFEPAPCAGEACYFLSGEPILSVVNKKLGKKLTVRYSKESLPELVLWKGIASGDFVVGIEPSTTRLSNDTFKILKPGESQTFDVEISLCDL